MEMNPLFKRFKIFNIDCLSIFEYNEKLKSLIYQYKGCLDYELKDVFLFFYKDFLKKKYKEYYLLPVPSSLNRIKERGFKHVEEMFKCLGLPILEDIIFKKDNEVQHLRNYKERVKNKEMFYLSNSSKLSNKNILIIDDVCTTGTSLKNVINLIKPIVNKKIKVLVIAKRDFSKEELMNLKDKSFILK